MLIIFLLNAILSVDGHFTKCACKPCDCRDYGSFLWVDCSYRNLTTIPDNIPTNTTHLDLSNNNLGPFLSMSIENLKDLEELNLNNNAVTMLWGHEFNAPRLKKLHLHRNSISYLSELSFKHFHSLEELTLYSNGLLYLGVGVFDNLISLRILDMSNNFLRLEDKVDQKLFSNLVQLRELNVDNNELWLWNLTGEEFVNCRYLEIFKAHNNQIAYLPRKGLFRKNRRLREIDLSNNRLMNLKTTEFSYSWHLESLNISNNLVLSFFDPPEGNFFLRSPRKLKLLDLCNNSLRTLPLDLLTRISSRATVVGIHNNFFDCTPYFLFRLTAYLSSTRNDVLSRSLIQCSKPDHLAGQVIGEFSCPKDGLFNICSTRLEPRCDKPYKYKLLEAGSQCVSRCECPDDKPVTINGVCSESEMCSFLDIGACYKERAKKTYSLEKQVYIPSCNDEGYYLPLQCREDDICWCTDTRGAKRCPMFYRNKVRDDVCTSGLNPKFELLPHQYPDTTCMQGTQTSSHMTCAIWGKGRIKQYDGTTFQVQADCYYDLISDMSRDSRYHLYVRFTKCDGKFCITMLQLYIDRVNLVRITTEFDIIYDNEYISLQVGSTLSLFDNKVKIARRSKTITIQMEDFEILYSNQNYLVLRINSDELSSTKGACGTTPSNDLQTGHNLFREWKLLPYCEDSREIFENKAPDENVTCQSISGMGFSRDLASQLIRGCEADVPEMGEGDSFCGSLAAGNAHQTTTSPQVTAADCY